MTVDSIESGQIEKDERNLESENRTKSFTRNCHRQSRRVDQNWRQIGSFTSWSSRKMAYFVEEW